MDYAQFRHKAGLGEHKTLPPWMFKPSKGIARPPCPNTQTVTIGHLTLTLEQRPDTANIKVRQGKFIIGQWSGNPVHAQAKIIQIREVIRHGV